jgi:hypothetical protein
VFFGDYGRRAKNYHYLPEPSVVKFDGKLLYRFNAVV